MNSIRQMARAMAAAAALAIGAGAAWGQTFTSSGAITIPVGGSATPYPSVINVSGVTQPITRMQVVLSGLSHTFPNDIDMLLVGPGGQTARIFSDVGGGADLVNAQFILTEGYPALTDSPLSSGVYAPTNLPDAADPFPAPAPPASASASLSVFNGLSANGTWTLYIVDDVSADSGSLASWSLRFNDAYSVPAQPAGQTVTYQGKLENAGVPVNGAADLTFSIWTNPLATVVADRLLGPIALSNVPVVNGLFTVNLPVPATVSDNQELWVQIEARSPAGSGGFTTLTPRVRLNPALQAQWARNAINATALNSTGRIFVGGTASPDDGESPGIWFRSPAEGGVLRSFLGHRNDTRIGFFGPAAVGWNSLQVNTTTGNTMLGADADATARLEVNGSTLIRTASALAPNVLAFGPYSTAVGGSVEGTDSVGIYRVNNAANDTELRIHIGDDTTAAFDSVVIGANPGNVWTQRFVFRSDGNAFKPGGGTWTVLSDPRSKHDIAPMHNTLDRLLQLKGYTYLYNDDVIAAGKALSGTQIGLMADDVARVFPDWVSTDTQGTRYVTERATTALMVEALRDLRTEKDAQIAKQQQVIDDLTARLAKLEAALNAQK
jgi:hypothetical protein